MKAYIRERVWHKFKKHCAYCGCNLEYKKMQVDHVKPLYRNDNLKTLEAWEVERGKDEESNYNPSCARCNRWKSTFSVEMFRQEIMKQTARLKRDNAGYRLAIDFGQIIEPVNSYIVFYFERFDDYKNK